MGAKQFRDHCKLDAEGKDCRVQAMAEMNFFARAQDRFLKVAKSQVELSENLKITGNKVLERI